MWPPEMCPIAYTAPTMTSMNANEIIPSCAIENGTLVPAEITPVAAADPAPTYTRNAVPSPSAISFCGVDGGAAMRFASLGEACVALKSVRHCRTAFHETYADQVGQSRGPHGESRTNND